MIDQFARMLEEESMFDANDIDLTSINPDLFKRYILEFPCFSSYRGKVTPEAVFKIYHDENPRFPFTEEQELVIEFVFELLSDLDMGFSISEAYEIWPKDLTQAMVRVLSAHTFLCYEGSV